MEFNFIEEVSKALDMLTVERLVRTSPMGAVRCKPCDKRLYTYVQARYALLRRVQDENVYMDLYLCPAQEGANYHLTDLDKRLKKEENQWFRREIEQKKALLQQFRGAPGLRGSDGPADRPFDVAKHNLVVMDGRGGPIAYPKALRRKIIRALVIPVQGLRKPQTGRMRRRWKPPRRTPRRNSARRDLPRGETMTKMLSWANAEKFHVDSEHRGCRPRGDGAEFRRRCRAREAEAVRRDLGEELGALGPLQGPEEWHQHRCSTNMGALGTVEFDGIYTCE